ncbi:hypothetical protein EON80_03580 [bacterium]|nr:MAG: hypothetical protein EON80_03580 [bacterium]
MSFFCLWISQFPAWVIAQDNPELANRRFAVSENGRIVSASPLAEKHGVRVGMPTHSARLWCSGLKIITRDAPREAIVWEEVQRAICAHTPRVEAIEPGLLYAAVDGTKISHLVHEWHAHGGQATDRATARLAALVADPQEIRCVRRGREENFADRVPLDFLLDTGLEDKCLEKLYSYGFRHIGDICELSGLELGEKFGADAGLLYELSRGALHEPNLYSVAAWAPPQEITARKSFELPAVEQAEWEEALDLLIGRVCRGLGSRSAQRFEIIAQTATSSVSTRRFLKQPARRPQQFEPLARTALKEALDSIQPLAPVVTGLEVRLSTFHLASAQTPPSKRWQRAFCEVQSFVSTLGSRFLMSEETCRAVKDLSQNFARPNLGAVNTMQGELASQNGCVGTLTLNKVRH